MNTPDNKIIKIEKEHLRSGQPSYNIKCLDGVNLLDVLKALYARKDINDIKEASKLNNVSILLKSTGSPRYMMGGTLGINTFIKYDKFLESKANTEPVNN